ncbi:MAG: hypothetical protein QM673_10405 [Gordonia sp. (in: high G+C Gram-positive bacteria)]
MTPDSQTADPQAAGSDTAGSANAPQSRPISVAELLALRDGASGDNENRRRAAAGRGRRRAGREGAVSVTELTGEIPRITTSSAHGSVPPGPPATRDFSSAAVSARLRPSPQSSDADESYAEKDNAVTGVIPVVGGGEATGLAILDEDDVVGVDLAGPPGSAPVGEPAPAIRLAGSGFAEVMEGDFESYRNFDDVEEQEKDAATTDAPVTSWLLAAGEAVAGLAVGVALFWGFTELWKWNVYFALILAVLVIFGIVTFTHVVRKSRDLLTTLLALGVGLIVTIGPLVLLAT